MTTNELSQVVNFIAKTSEYQNELVGFTVSKSNINELGFKIHLFEIRPNGDLPSSFKFIKTFSVLDQLFIPTVCVIIRHNDETNQVEFQIF